VRQQDNLVCRQQGVQAGDQPPGRCRAAGGREGTIAHHLRPDCAEAEYALIASLKEQERRRALDMAVSANHRAVHLAITLYTDRQTDCCHYRQSLYAGIRGDNPPDIGRVRFNCASFCTVGWFESSVAALFLSVRQMWTAKKPAPLHEFQTEPDGRRLSFCL
jgi:hypothetical protein